MKDVVRLERQLHNVMARMAASLAPPPSAEAAATAAGCFSLPAEYLPNPHFNALLALHLSGGLAASATAAAAAAAAAGTPGGERQGGGGSGDGTPGLATGGGGTSPVPDTRGTSEGAPEDMEQDV